MLSVNKGIEQRIGTENCPEIEMLDQVVAAIINDSLDNSRWAKTPDGPAATNPSSVSSGHRRSNRLQEAANLSNTPTTARQANRFAALAEGPDALDVNHATSAHNADPVSNSHKAGSHQTATSRPNDRSRSSQLRLTKHTTPQTTTCPFITNDKADSSQPSQLTPANLPPKPPLNQAQMKAKDGRERLTNTLEAILASEKNRWEDFLISVRRIAATVEAEVQDASARHPQWIGPLQKALTKVFRDTATRALFTPAATIPEHRETASLPHPAPTSTKTPPKSQGDKVTGKSTYATVVAAATKVASTNSRLDLQTAKRPKNTAPPADKRIMVRFALDANARSTQPFAVKTAVANVLNDRRAVTDAYPVESGFALIPAPGKREDILKKAAEIANALGATKVEPQEAWGTLLLGPVPRSVTVFNATNGTLHTTDTTPEMIIEELELSTRMPTPKKVAWAKASAEITNEGEGTVVIMVASNLLSKWPRRVRIFGQASELRPLRQKLDVQTCERCFGYHHSRNCARPEKCSTCGRARHGGACEATPRCLNCHGPHASNDMACPARPRRVNKTIVKPNSSQLRKIRYLQEKQNPLPLGKAAASQSPPSRPGPGLVPQETDRQTPAPSNE